MTLQELLQRNKKSDAQKWVVSIQICQNLQEKEVNVRKKQMVIQVYCYVGTAIIIGTISAEVLLKQKFMF